MKTRAIDTPLIHTSTIRTYFTPRSIVSGEADAVCEVRIAISLIKTGRRVAYWFHCSLVGGALVNACESLPWLLRGNVRGGIGESIRLPTPK